MQVAHEQLVQSSQRLREQGQACPNELMRSLMLLHSYVLVKTLVRLGDHPVTHPHTMRFIVACCLQRSIVNAKPSGLSE